jgi:DNA polymerase eta
MQPLRSRKGVATYRHLLSPSSLTPQNPLRVIALVDIDAAYAQFEQVRLGLPSDRPLVCAQWQSLIAVNYRMSLGLESRRPGLS